MRIPRSWIHVFFWGGPIVLIITVCAAIVTPINSGRGKLPLLGLQSRSGDNWGQIT